MTQHATAIRQTNRRVTAAATLTAPRPPQRQRPLRPLQRPQPPRQPPPPPPPQPQPLLPQRQQPPPQQQQQRQQQHLLPQRPPHRHLQSFPTRRSSDLAAGRQDIGVLGPQHAVLAITLVTS